MDDLAYGILIAASTQDDDPDLRQWATVECAKRWPKGMQGLQRYWKQHLPGKHGDFMGCVNTLSKHFGDDGAKRLCAWWHKKMTGAWPGQEGKHKSAGIDWESRFVDGS